MSILPDTPRVLVAVGIALAVLIGGSLLFLRLPSRAPMVLFIAFELVAAVSGVCVMARVRDHWRNHFFETRVELHPIPRHWAAGWAFCDDPRDPKTIALASYEPNLGHHWFFYPLMGRRLQNRVVYVHTDATEGGRRLMSEEHMAADFSTWTSDLREAEVTHIFVQLNPDLPLDDRRREPVEAGWTRARPDAFKLLDQSNHYRVYRIVGRSLGWKSEAAP